MLHQNPISFQVNILLDLLFILRRYSILKYTHSSFITRNISCKNMLPIQFIKGNQLVIVRGYFQTSNDIRWIKLFSNYITFNSTKWNNIHVGTMYSLMIMVSFPSVWLVYDYPIKYSFMIRKLFVHVLVVYIIPYVFLDMLPCLFPDKWQVIIADWSLMLG